MKSLQVATEIIANVCGAASSVRSLEDLESQSAQINQSMSWLMNEFAEKNQNFELQCMTNQKFNEHRIMVLMIIIYSILSILIVGFFCSILVYITKCHNELIGIYGLFILVPQEALQTMADRCKDLLRALRVSEEIIQHADLEKREKAKKITARDQ